MPAAWSLPSSVTSKLTECSRHPSATLSASPTGPAPGRPLVLITSEMLPLEIN